LAVRSPIVALHCPVSAPCSPLFAFCCLHVQQFGMGEPTVLPGQPGENPAVFAVQVPVVLLVVQPQVSHHGANGRLPGTWLTLLGEIPSLGARVAIELLQVVLDRVVAEVLDRRFWIRRKPQFAAVELYSAVQTLGEPEVPSLQDTRHRVSRPPAAMLDPLPTEVGLERDRYCRDFVPSFADGLCDQDACLRRNALVRVQKPQPVKPCLSDGHVPRRIEIGDHGMADGAGHEGPSQFHGAIPALHVDEQDLGHVRQQRPQALDDVGFFIAGQDNPSNHGTIPLRLETNKYQTAGRRPEFCAGWFRADPTANGVFPVSACPFSRQEWLHRPLVPTRPKRSKSSRTRD